MLKYVIRDRNKGSDRSSKEDDCNKEIDCPNNKEK